MLNFSHFVSIEESQLTTVITSNKLGSNIVIEISVANTSTSWSVVDWSNNSNYWSSSVLSENEHRVIQTVLSGNENESFGSIGDQPIARRDVKTLRGLTWLNDEVKDHLRSNDKNSNSLMNRSSTFIWLWSPVKVEKMETSVSMRLAHFFIQNWQKTAQHIPVGIDGCVEAMWHFLITILFLFRFIRIITGH